MCIGKLTIPSETIEVEVISSTKKMAKQDTAKKILEKIEGSGIIIEEKHVEKKIDPPNLIGLLQEFCVKANLPLPEYKYKQIGSMHEPVFECTVTMYYSEKKLLFPGHGLNKKQSKQNAAAKCYKYLSDNSQ